MNENNRPAAHQKIIRFCTDPHINLRILSRLDFHTLRVIQDATGCTPVAVLMAHWVQSGEAFPIDPAWPCGMGRAWYRQAGLVAVEPEALNGI